MYTIGEISKMFNIPASTLRYYDKIGLFPSLNKSSANIRQFSDSDITTLETIQCLKNSGLQISEIKDYFELCNEGNSTLEKRQKLFESSEERIKSQIKTLQHTLNMLKIKNYYYKISIERGGEEFVDISDVELLPPDLKDEFNHYYSK